MTPLAYLYTHKETGEKRVSLTPWNPDGKKWRKSWTETPLVSIDAVVTTR